VKTDCRRQCRLRRGATPGQPGQIDWAGLPANLDLAFSREQRDKVYAQHVMRKQGSGRWPGDGAQLCVCEIRS
jgi:hypothetical protein